MSYKTVLVEDEVIAMSSLKRILVEFENKVEIVGTAANGPDAVGIINELKPQLVFLDIQIPGFNGFDVLKRLDYKPKVIFTTAFDQYALDAFDNLTIDYVLKPLSADKIAKAIDKLEQLGQTSDARIDSLLEYLNTPKRISIQADNKIVFLTPDEIYFCSSDSKYTRIHTYNDSYLVTKTLSQLETELGKSFLRLHRGNLVNSIYIKEIIKLSSVKWIARMQDKKHTELPISRGAHKLFQY